MSGYHWTRRGVPPPESGITVSTWGHFSARVTGKPSVLLSDTHTTIIIDEVHNRDASMAAVARILAKRRNVMIMTATLRLDARHVPLGRIKIIKAPFPSPYSCTHEDEWGARISDVAVREAKRCDGTVLCFIPEIFKCEKARLEVSSTGINCSVFSSKHDFEPAKVIFSTAVGEDGVNIPNVAVVICSGRMIVKHQGRMLNVPVDPDTAKQRDGRGGRFREARCIRLGPIVDMAYDVYPTADVYCEDPAIWHDVFDLETPLLPISTRGGRIYIPDIDEGFAFTAKESRAFCRFALRHDTPQDAATSATNLRGDENHDDIFDECDDLRERLIADPTLIIKIVATRPFKVRTSTGFRNWGWIRLVDGAITADDSRSPMVHVMGDRAIRTSTGVLVDTEYKLPAAANWIMLRRTINLREMLRIWAVHSHFQDDSAVRRLLRNVPLKMTRDASEVTMVRNEVAKLADLLGVSVYLRVGSLTSYIRGPLEITNAVALLVATPEGCRVAIWQRASTAPAIADTTSIAVNISASSPLARVPCYWPNVTSNMKFRFQAGDPMLEPINAWAWHLVSNGEGQCFNAVCDVLNCQRMSNTTPVKVDDLLDHLTMHDRHADALYVEGRDIIRISRNLKHVKSHARLFVHGNHVAVGVLLKTDRVDGYYPPEPLKDLALPCHDPDMSNHDRPDVCKDWRHLYLAQDHGVLTPERWSPWEDIETRLDSIFGAEYQTFPAGLTVEHRTDPRVKKLAGWASYHRTQVTIIYKDKGSFVILPDVSRPCHSRAKPGRRVIVQLGEHGARHWFSEDYGRCAYREVFVDEYIGRSLKTNRDVVSLGSTINTPRLTDARYRKARFFYTCKAIELFAEFSDSNLNRDYLRSKRWPHDDPPSFQGPGLNTFTDNQVWLSEQLAQYDRRSKIKLLHSVYALLAYYRHHRSFNRSTTHFYAAIITLLNLG